MSLSDILVRCDGYNFVADKCVADRLMTLEELIETCENLYCENKRLEEQIEDLEQDIEDNYIRRAMSDYTGSYEDDRY